jgi:hypothetical protein
MALNLSTLTNSATSGDVLAEALTTADFLEPTPVLRNLARGSNKGGDAKQGTALNQPKALPLDANGKGYCYLPVTTGNAPAVTFPTIGANDNFVLEMVVYIVNLEDFHVVSGSNNHRILIYSPSGVPSFQYRDSSNNNNAALSGSLSAGLSTLRFEKTGSTLVFKQNGAVKGTINNITAAPTFTHLSFNGQFSTSRLPLNGYIQSVTLSIGGTEQLNCDFTATNVRHGDTKFKCATGQVVTINQSGNDPATVIKKPVLRFDGANDFMDGLLNQTVTGGYLFAAFSVLGNGGEVQSRIFSMNSTGALEYEAGGFDLRRNSVDGSNLEFRYNGEQAATIHQDVMDDSLGDILLEHQFQNGAQVSKLNNANEANGTTSLSGVLSSEEFRISALKGATSRNGALDLELLALFPATITDAQADDVRNYINNRNNVFDLKDGFGYYFFDPQIFPIVDPADFVSYWNGNIVGSDLTLNASVSQSVVNHRPARDGYKVTFNDNADHLVVASPLSGGQAGWQIVGTSLGTFVYRVDNDAVTELNLLGNAGAVRSIGDLYGIILLPASATGKDIEDARKLLIDRGASDAVSASSVQQFWQSRNDIVEFKQVDTSSVTSFKDGWRFCASLEIFPPLQAPNCTNFLNAWQGTSALKSFPENAKLGTEANNVNFTSAWESSGLTSFSTPLPTATNLAAAFRFCNPLVSFTLDDLPLVTSVATTWQNTRFQSFSTKLPKVTSCYAAWYGNAALVDFSADVFANWNPSSISSGVFNIAWDGCSALTAQSVENILVSIDASGKYATSDGDPYQNTVNTQLADAGIDIDYDGTTLSAATDSAITSLRGKGWLIFINGVERIP